MTSIDAISSALGSSSGIGSIASSLGTSSVSSITGDDDTSTSATGASDFASALGGVVDGAQSLQGTANTLALKVAEGDLDSIGDAQVASTRAEVTLELVASLRNKAVDGLSQIMNMQA